MGAFKHVGLVGVTGVGAALCYQNIVVESMKRSGTHPQLTIHNMPYDQYTQQDNTKIGQTVLASLTTLAEAGADVIVTTANTVSYTFKTIKEGFPKVPVVDVVDAVVEACNQLNTKKVSVLGTLITMNFVYNEKLSAEGFELIQPPLSEQEEIEKIISEELIYGIASESSRKRVLEIIEGVQKQGSEAIVLACTEFPILLTAEDVKGAAVIDSSEVIVNKVLELTWSEEQAIRKGHPEDEDEKNNEDLLFSDSSKFFQYDQNPEVRAFIQEGIRLLNETNYDGARMSFEKGVSLDKNDPEATTWLAIALGKKMEITNIVNKMRLMPKFEKAVKSALKLAPDSPMVRRINGIRLLKTPTEFGGNVGKAIEELQYSINHGMEDAEVYQLIGRAYLDLGDKEKGEQALERVKELSLQS
ncbi:amino acid racemase [Mesobacillus foraminis]|uniref:amino acid racemase n=1 Tax=Mesobacillus foraminis TaxID=279826 RepID=UPI001BE60CA3|nr:amino acid racemase [Mesobacillus foraminis]MBT2759322.1 amino acid racemase [Mesobacillus foraminis]